MKNLMENPMAYEVVEELKNNTTNELVNETQILDFLRGMSPDGDFRTFEEQGERMRVHGLSLGLSEEECDEVKASVLEVLTNTTVSNLNIEAQTFIKTTIYPSERAYNNIVTIRNSLTSGGLSWTLISKQTV